MRRSPSLMRDRVNEVSEPLVPRRAKVVHTSRGPEVRSPKRNRLLGVFNESGQLEIKYRDELVIVEVPFSVSRPR